MEILIVIVLVLLSGLFSGLTLGLLSLDTQSLRRRAKHGDRHAAAIYPVREKGNLLLTTLLLGNVVVNTTLSIFLGSLASGLVAGIIATALIVVFGEIIPQAVISRYALWFGAKTLWFTKLVMLVMLPVSWPIAKLLDAALGSELPTTYSSKELMDIISEHEDSEHSSIDADEERIVHGALQFSHQTVREVMTPVARVHMYEAGVHINDDFYEEVTESGYSRMPVYDNKINNIIGILFIKELLTEEEGIAISDTKDALVRDFLELSETAKLDALLTRMIKARQHLAIVRNKQGDFVGVISLEDIVEEIIQQEIIDEDDVVS